MAAWRRCAKCNYIRHANDTNRSRPDTCPMCGAIYEKAELASSRPRRRRTDAVHNYFFRKKCGSCSEIFSAFAKQCPRCKTSNRGLPLRFVLASGAAIVLAVTVVSGMYASTPMTSPFPGISDGHFASCVQLSKDWSRVSEEFGTSSPITLQAQNDWHAACSRKALRDVANRTSTRLPTTPNGWVVATVE